MGLSINRKSGPIWATRSEAPLTRNSIFTRAEWPLEFDDVSMDDILIQNAQVYASRHRLRLAERLGFGLHGIIFVAEGNFEAGKTAIFDLPPCIFDDRPRPIRRFIVLPFLPE